MTPPTLPILSIREALRAVVARGNRVVITAPTGAGKSTQVPRYLLESDAVSGQILVLQPRRLAARVLAERVARELGQEPGQAVGYRTRFEHCGGASTRLWFITEGLLPRRLLESPELAGVGAVVFDEFHERRLTSDITLGLLRRLQQRRPDLRLVVMSATLDAEAVQAYLGGCPHLHADGRLYPVDIRYAERPARVEIWEDAARAAAGVVREEPAGDLLVFLPGVYEIQRTMAVCRRMLSNLEILPLYGDLPPAVQHRVMEPGAARRLILATNIAETSLTVPGVRHVIDSGLARQGRYDAGRGLTLLELGPISRDAADQRAGRAGREGPGTCSRLWTLAEQQRKPSRTAPEVQRVDLAEALLLMAAMGTVEPGVFDWFEAPRPEALEQGLAELRSLGLIDPAGFHLTALGREISGVPAHPRLGRLLHAAAAEGCLEDAAVAAALLGERPVLRGGASLPEAEALSSDLLGLVEVVRSAHAAGFDQGFCESRGVLAGPARQVWSAARILLGASRRLGWPQHRAGDRVTAFGRSVLAAFPDRLARRRDAGTLLCELPAGRSAELVRESGVREARLLVAGEIRETGGRGRPLKTLISLATEVREEWLMDLFPEAWESQDRTVWDDRRHQVVRRLRTTCLGVVLEDREVTTLDAELAAEILAGELANGRLPLHGWDRTVEEWIERVRWTASVFPERGLLTYDETDRAVILRELCTGSSRYREVKDRPCLDAVRHALSHDDVRFVEAMAPAWLPLPSGRRMRLDYAAGRPPRGRTRIQDLYGLTTTPRIAGGRVPLLIDILAPNMRTVQITDDLEGFWREAYPRIRRELARRYPKHEWR
ncbi:MAG: ATP-dependent helicase HrpB [Lentisphaerae bacterium]|nr:ATP-dependent helicase HrpB [Lentisphaerota bacterium]